MQKSERYGYVFQETWTAKPVNRYTDNKNMLDH